MKPSLPPPPPAAPPHVTPLHFPPLRPCPASQPSRQAAPRSHAALAAAAARCPMPCVYSRDNPPPHGNDATRPAGEALPPRLPCSHLLELFRKEGSRRGGGHRCAFDSKRIFALSLSFIFSLPPRGCEGKRRSGRMI